MYWPSVERDMLSVEDLSGSSCYDTIKCSRQDKQEYTVSSLGSCSSQYAKLSVVMLQFWTPTAVASYRACWQIFACLHVVQYDELQTLHLPLFSKTDFLQTEY